MYRFLHYQSNLLSYNICIVTLFFMWSHQTCSTDLHMNIIQITWPWWYQTCFIFHVIISDWTFFFFWPYELILILWHLKHIGSDTNWRASWTIQNLSPTKPHKQRTSSRVTHNIHIRLQWHVHILPTIWCPKTDPRCIC